MRLSCSEPLTRVMRKRVCCAPPSHRFITGMDGSTFAHGSICGAPLSGLNHSPEWQAKQAALPHAHPDKGTLEKGGVNFALFSANASKVELCFVRAFGFRSGMIDVSHSQRSP